MLKHLLFSKLKLNTLLHGHVRLCFWSLIPTCLPQSFIHLDHQPLSPHTPRPSGLHSLPSLFSSPCPVAPCADPAPWAAIPPDSSKPLDVLASFLNRSCAPTAPAGPLSVLHGSSSKSSLGPSAPTSPNLSDQLSLLLIHKENRSHKMGIPSSSCHLIRASPFLLLKPDGDQLLPLPWA